MRDGLLFCAGRLEIVSVEVDELRHLESIESMPHQFESILNRVLVRCHRRNLSRGYRQGQRFSSWAGGRRSVE